MKKSLLVLCALAMTSASSYAADAQWEIWSGGIGSLDFVTQSGSSMTQINLFNGMPIKPAISYMIGNGLQAKLSPSWISTGTTSSTTSTLEAMIGLTYNFMGNMDEAWYVEAMIGLNINTYITGITGTTVSTGTVTGSAMKVGAGKRFKLVDHVHWTPEVAYKVVNNNTNTSDLSIIPVQFTFQM